MNRALCVCALLSLASCKSNTVVPRTEVLLQIEAERLVKLAADHMQIEISSGPQGGELTQSEAEEYDLVSDEFNWPASLALMAKPGHEDHVFEVTIHIDARGKRVARSKVKSSFIKHQTLLLKTLLYGECLNKLDCDEAQTCVAPDGTARCESGEIAASTLPRFTVGGDRAGEPAADGGEGAAGAAQEGGSGGQRAAGSGGQRAAAGSSGGGGGGQSGAQAGGGSTAGAAGGAPACERRGAEQCDNGVDDDCNGKLDCADPACSEVTQCVPNGSVVGVLVPETSVCPLGYDKGVQLIHRGLNDPGCGGCSCRPVPTTCTPHAWLYATTTECTADIPPYSAGKQAMVAIPQKPGCTSGPVGSSVGIETPAGWRAKVVKSEDACSSSGSAIALPPTWGTTMKLCMTSAKRNGCNVGQACVPKPSTGQVCAQRELAACPGSTSLQTWQREYTDERTCGSCGCSARGGSCSQIVVNLGHDWSCNTVDSSLKDGEKTCVLSTYSPPAFYDGFPLDPTCSASAPVTGSVKPASPLELCCVN